jgi:hypothetical protein
MCTFTTLICAHLLHLYVQIYYTYMCTFTTPTCVHSIRVQVYIHYTYMCTFSSRTSAHYYTYMYIFPTRICVLIAKRYNSFLLALLNSQRFADAVNVSLLGVAIADLGGLVCLLWSNLATHPLLIQYVELPYQPNEFILLTAGMLL